MSVSREVVKRLLKVDKWDKIPLQNKYKKKPMIYYKSKRKGYLKSIFISYQEDKVIKEMCDEYKGNILLKLPWAGYFKKYKGKDIIYIDSNEFYIKDIKKMVKGWKKNVEKKKEDKKRKKRVKKGKKGGVLMKF